jgi:hypothetical protein
MIMMAATQTLQEKMPVGQILLMEDVLQSSNWDDDEDEDDDDLSEDYDDYSAQDDSSSCWSENSDDGDEDNMDAKSRVSLMSLDALLVLKQHTAPRAPPPSSSLNKKGKAALVSAMSIRSQRFQYRKARPAPLTRGVARSESLPKRFSRPVVTTIEQEASAQKDTSSEDSNVKPTDHYQALCEKNGMPVQFVPLDESHGTFFRPNTPDNKAAFKTELVNAVRNQDLEAIQDLHQNRGFSLEGRSPVTGEALLHVCVRRGTPDILRYMLQKAKVYPRVCCDYGRSPLHDACWSNDSKSLELMKMLIQASPNMLRMLDRRGFSPLDYIPRDRWAQCCAFLDKHQNIILPTYNETTSPPCRDVEMRP